VIEDIDHFDQRFSVKTWLFGILVNIARAHGVPGGRTIPFATTADFTDEPALDPRRFRHRDPRTRGAWKQPPHPRVAPEQRALDAETVETIRRRDRSTPARPTRGPHPA
jgi:RNA polymerase sigma-70 factor (ECF subfamily)